MLKDFKFYSKLFNSQAANGFSLALQVNDFIHVLVDLYFNAATMTVKFMGSIEDAAPDFTAAQSKTNRWSYIKVVDYQSGSSIAGNTGIVESPTITEERLVEFNTNGLKWIAIQVTGYSAGDVSVDVSCFNNE